MSLHLIHLMRLQQIQVRVLLALHTSAVPLTRHSLMDLMGERVSRRAVDGLERLGLIRGTVDALNGKRLTWELTPVGREAIAWAEQGETARPRSGGGASSGSEGYRR